MTALLYGVPPDYLPAMAVVSTIMLGVAALAYLLPRYGPLESTQLLTR